MADSILDGVKKILGLPLDDTSFDFDVITHINTAFSTLQQLGIGPTAGFMIVDNTAEWDAFLGADTRLNSVKTYVWLRVKSLFDPPQTAHLIAAMKEQITELEWRLNVHVEETIWVDPTVDSSDLPSSDTLDGGAP